MQTKVSRWGNCLAIRIPAVYARDLALEDGTDVEISVVNGRLTVAAPRPHYTLDELVAGITPENQHGETDWGQPMGKEEW